MRSFVRAIMTDAEPTTQPARQSNEDADQQLAGDAAD
jgi:hypothetical protein